LPSASQGCIAMPTPDPPIQQRSKCDRRKVISVAELKGVSSSVASGRQAHERCARPQCVIDSGLDRKRVINYTIPFGTEVANIDRGLRR
jgi:hypothetical protein